KYLNPDMFLEFWQSMRITLSYESLIQKCYNSAIIEINKIKQLKGQEPSIYVAKDIKYCLVCVNAYKRHMNKDRERLIERPDLEINAIPAIKDSLVDSTIDLILRDFPKTLDLLNGKITAKTVNASLAELETGLKQSRIRLSTYRRRKFRQSILLNYDSVYTRFLPQIEKSYHLHNTKIDRMVIDVYHTDLYTHDSQLKTIINSKLRKIQTTLSKKRILTQLYIDTLEDTYPEDSDIESIKEHYQKVRESNLEEGYYHNGTIVFEDGGIKGIFTFKPYKNGAPIRLRLIVNLQTLIQRDLFNEYPEKEKIYKEHTWSKGSETNFIMPEDYDYYLQNEADWCTHLEDYAKIRFFELISEHLKVGVPNPDDAIIYVSQLEVCYEQMFRRHKVINPTIKQYCKFPSLHEYFLELYAKFHRFSNKYSNLKYEAESARPSFYCDIPSPDPTLPLMQYKAYPKFRDMDNQIMIRHEMIPTKIMKHICADAEDEIPIASKVLSNPAYCRETIERFFQFELKHNGTNGFGYNNRYREWKNPDPRSLIHQTVRTAIFGSEDKYHKFKPQFQSFLDTWILPSGFPANYRKRMLELGYITKKKRGMYQATESFIRLMTQLA
ncbi:MAG: hypothetical protein KAS32_08975, partial [Candidatus Peribacteraceae bacterium]|nr:hypothetical protein [Candidatus Peribacteraceae bacterium]